MGWGQTQPAPAMYFCQRGYRLLEPFETFYDRNTSSFVSGAHDLLNASSFWRLVNDKLPAALTIVSAEPETDTDISAPSDDAVVLPGGPSPPPTAAVAVVAGAAGAAAAAAGVPQ